MPAMSLKAPRVAAKGSNFVGILRAIEARFGADATREMLTLLPRELATALRENQVLAVGWYPVEWYAQMHAAIDAAFGGGLGVARSLGHDATLADFSGLHRLIGSMLTAQTIFAQSHRLMGLYWKGGTIERLELTTGYVRLRFDGWQGFTMFLWEDIMGSLEALLELCRARYVRSRALDAPSASCDSIVIEARWTE
jgi:hypothetical protein